MYHPKEIPLEVVVGREVVFRLPHKVDLLLLLVSREDEVQWEVTQGLEPWVAIPSSEVRFIPQEELTPAWKAYQERARREIEASWETYTPGPNAIDTIVYGVTPTGTHSATGPEELRPGKYQVVIFGALHVACGGFEISA